MSLKKSLILSLCCFSFLLSCPVIAMEEDFIKAPRSMNPFGPDPEIAVICDNMYRTQARCCTFVAIIQCLNLGLQGLSQDDSRILAARKMGQLMSRQDRVHFDNPVFCQVSGITNPRLYMLLCEMADKMDQFTTVDAALLREYLETATDQQGVGLYVRLNELAGWDQLIASNTPGIVTAMLGSLTLEE